MILVPLDALLTVGVPQEDGGISEQYDRLTEGSRLIHFGL